MMGKPMRAAAALLALLCSASHVRGAESSPCGEEVKKFCPDVAQGRGALLHCLGPHMSEVSTDCRIHLERLKQRRDLMVQRQRKARAKRAARPTTLPASPHPEGTPSAAATPKS